MQLSAGSGRLHIATASGDADPAGAIPRYDSGAPLCFLHVPKTGGTTVRLIIENQADGDRTYPSGSAAFTKGMTLQRSLAAGDDMSRFEVIHGHFGNQVVEHLAAGTNYFTWLREPRQRLLSSFFFRMQQANPRDEAYVRLRDGERVESVFMRWLDQQPSMQAFFLLGFWDFEASRARWSTDNPDTSVDEAALLLADRCFFIGLLEDQERSVDALCAITSILPPGVPTRRNAGSRRQELALTADEERRLDATLEPQVAFYQQMVARHRQHMDTLVDRYPDNPALRLIGNREQLRRHLLEQHDVVPHRPAVRWKAWDAVLGDNLDGRECLQQPDGTMARWRWTGPSPDTMVHLERPTGTRLEVSIQVNPATPPAHLRAARVQVDGRPVALRVMQGADGLWALTGPVSPARPKRPGERLRLDIHTPLMIDEREIPPHIGVRKLGLALSAIEIGPRRRREARRLWRLLRKILPG
ncbi:MAG: sulfotransferase family 2 domain-containing protein [Devosia sp.]|nr:sulfotransferase family 2 domain-containing protein [Devosia sp.]